MQAASRLFLLSIMIVVMAWTQPTFAYQRLLGCEEFDLPSYAILVDEENISQDRLSDSVFHRSAATIVFRVSQSGYDQRDDVVRAIQSEVRPLLADSAWMLVGIEVRGAASPEGSLAYNDHLSRRRAQAMVDLLSTQLDSTARANIKVNTTPEDYPYLQWLLEQDGDPASLVVGDIIARYTIDDPVSIKQALRQADGGRLWQRLLRDYYPKLRTARMVVLLRKVAPHAYIVSEAQLIEQCAQSIEESRANLDLASPLPVALPAIERPRAPRPHMLAVNTNLLYDAFYMPQYGWAPMPNIGLEWFPRYGRYTVQAQMLFPYWHKWGQHKFFQIRDYHLEVRRYFNPGMRHTGAYLALYANANKYGIGLSESKGWKGEGWGGAFKAGYVWGLGAHWRIEAHAAVGGYTTRYDPYVYGNPITGAQDGYYYDYTGESKDFKRRNHRFNWFGPTEIGVTISFDLLHYR